MLVRCAVLVTMMGLVGCSGASNNGFFDSENNQTDPGDAGPKALGSKSKKDGGADGGAEETRAGDAGTTQKDAATTANTCTVANITFGKSACDVCSTGACCAQWKACDKNPDCVKLLKCAVECAGDQDCVSTCVLVYSDGKDDVVAVNDCQNKNCAAQCK